jgi:hypothetical protein
LVEQLIRNQQVSGSNPLIGSRQNKAPDGSSVGGFVVGAWLLRLALSGLRAGIEHVDQGGEVVLVQALASALLEHGLERALKGQVGA